MPGSVPLDCGRRMSGADMFVESPAEAPNAPLWVSLKLESDGAGTSPWPRPLQLVSDTEELFRLSKAVPIASLGSRGPREV